jgi:hypothetical protein
VVTRLGLTFKEDELKEFISPDFWHGKADKVISPNN